MTMFLNLIADRPIEKGRHYISPGGYELLFSNGDRVAFDFMDYYGKIDDAYPYRLMCECDELDIYAFDSDYAQDNGTIPAKELGRMLSSYRVSKIIECFVYTGETGEDPEINIVGIETMSFEFDGKTVNVDKEVLDEYDFSA